MTLLDIPLYDQTIDPDNNHWNDCGPECIRMVAEYYGMAFSLTSIKAAETGDANYLGYTYTWQMQNWFLARGIPCVVTQPKDVAAVARDNLTKGFPSIYLRYWNLVNLTGGHFTVIKGDEDNLSLINNPWQGVENKWSWDDVNRYSLGNFLIIIQKKKETLVNPQLQTAAIAYYETFPGVKCNPDTALSKGFFRMWDNWVKSGNDDLLNPTPPLYNEWTDPKTGYVYLPLDNGIVLKYWDSKLSQIEAKERKQVFTDAGWPLV